jgi:tetratricopeptide (TPR) repeat protein
MKPLAILPLLLSLAACASNSTQARLDDAKQYFAEGDAAYKAGQAERAIDLYTKCIEANPEFAAAYLWRGNAWRLIAGDRTSKVPQNDALRNAVNDYTLAANRNPMLYDAYWNRACIYMKQARSKEAVSDLLQCTTLHAKDPEPHLEVARVYETRFEDKQVLALEHYEKYVEFGGSDPDIVKKVQQYRDLKKQMAPAPTGKAPTADDEKKAHELRGQAMEFAKQGKKEETFKALEELLTKYGHTKFVKDNLQSLGAMRSAYAPKK